jgi:hypothetical protein
MTLPAFRQQAEADAVIEFLDWGSIRITKPARTGPAETLDKPSFLEIIAKPEFAKDLAVVVMDKRWSIASDAVSLDDIEACLRRAGIRRIVFQQARSFRDPKTGFPILRDTEPSP